MRILVVDDDEIPRKMLSLSLRRLGYECTAVDSGTEALKIIRQQKIAVVIADWVMPEMDGITLCRAIREDDAITHIYIILLTAKQDQKSKLEGFDAGIDAFIQKPYNMDELDAQIKVGIRIVNLERGLIEEQQKVLRYAHEMEELASQRASQLMHADKMATLGTLSAGVAHEINNPTTFIGGNAQILEEYWRFIEPHLLLIPHADPDYERIHYVVDEMPGILSGIRNGAVRITRIVNGLKSFARQSKMHSVAFDVHAKIEEALVLCGNSLRYSVVVEKDLSATLVEVFGDPQRMGQVFINLFTNAVDAMEGRNESHLYIGTANCGSHLLVTVRDNGSGIPDSIIKEIWNPFFTTKPVGKGTGLGLSISLGIIEEMGGTVTVANIAEGGAQFLISLPVHTNK